MTLAQVLVDRSRLTLIDAAKVTWADDELLGYLNAGIAQACGTLLDIYVKAQMTNLVAGVRQTLPAGGLVLIDIPRNGAGGAVQQAQSSEFGRTTENWAAAAASANVGYYFFDPRNPASFLVSPPATAGASVELVFGAVPDPIALGAQVPISPAFDTALWAYTNALAYAKSTKRQDLTKTNAFLGLYNGVLDTWKKGRATTVKPPDAKGVF